MGWAGVEAVGTKEHKPMHLTQAGPRKTVKGKHQMHRYPAMGEPRAGLQFDRFTHRSPLLSKPSSHVESPSPAPRPYESLVHAPVGRGVCLRQPGSLGSRGLFKTGGNCMTQPL